MYKFEPAQKWIPVTRELPAKNDNYLIQVASTDGTATVEFIDVDHYGPDWLHYPKQTENRADKRVVVAWQPLPQYYKGE